MMFKDPFEHTPTNTSRWLTLAYAVVLIYVTAHPLSAFRWTTASPFGFVFKPWSAAGVTSFDLWVNVVAYAPLGFGLVWMLFQSRTCRWGSAKWNGGVLVVLAILLSGFLSFFLESLQSYSTERVASLWDVMCNTSGALIGALLAVLIKGRVSWVGRIISHCIAPHRGALWVVIGLWALAQVHPQRWSFMTAPLTVLTHGWLPIQGVSMPLTAQQLRHLETIASVVAVSGMLSLIRLGLHRRLHFFSRSVFLLGSLILIFVWQAVVYGIQYGWGEWRLLANDGMIDAARFIVVVYLAWALLPTPWVVVGSVTSLALHMALAQMLPMHPYGANVELWQEGRLIHLYGLTSLVSAVWPVLALAALVLQSKYRESRESNR
jgi:glycopeptide antibiotics resistance protein